MVFRRKEPILHFSTDSSRRCLVTLDVVTDVRRDNPMWQAALQQAIAQGKWTIIAQQPVITESEIKRYNRGLTAIHLPVRRWYTHE